MGDALIDVFHKYHHSMLGRPGTADITMYVPFMSACGCTIHSMTRPDRLNQPACNFPIGIGFGSRDAFASSQGAEELLSIQKKHNGGRVNLFKFGGDTKETGGTHCFPQE